MKVVSLSDALVDDVQRGDLSPRLYRYMGAAGSLAAGPEATLIELSQPGAKVPSHFHDVDQFQVFVKGGGRVGGAPLPPITIHYADAYAPYGPIVAGEQGVSWFTLRAVSSGGHFGMPQSRNLIRQKGGRNLSGQFQPGLESSSGRAEGHRESIFGSHEDGLEVAAIRLSVNGQLADPASEGGQFWLVCTGEVVFSGNLYGPLTLFFSERGEAAPVLHGSDRGAEVLSLKFPKPTARLGSDPTKLNERQYVAA